MRTRVAYCIGDSGVYRGPSTQISCPARRTPENTRAKPMNTSSVVGAAAGVAAGVGAGSGAAAGASAFGAVGNTYNSHRAAGDDRPSLASTAARHLNMR